MVRLRASKKQREEALTAIANIGERPKPVAHVARTRRISKWMRKLGWAYETPRNGLRRRLYCLSIERHRWWDWGHRLMILTGSDFGGNWSPPEPPTWWYRQLPRAASKRTGFPRRSHFQLIRDYDTFRAFTEGLNEDAMYEWRAIGTSQDGDLHIGREYWSHHYTSVHRSEWRLIRRWLRMARRHNWYGLRSWLYFTALHAAVNQRRPFRCNITPPRGSNGYSHWHCGEKKKHQGDHRFNNYTWPGGEEKVVYEPR